MINIAVCITASRIVLTPVVMISLLQGRWSLAAAVFTIAALTDLLDGFVARRFSQQSRFGQVFDPIADKCLLMGTMYTLLMVVPVFGWHTMAVYFLLAKELIFLLVGGGLLYRYRFFIVPSRLSRMVSIAEIVLVLTMLSTLIVYGYVPTLLLSVLLAVNVLLSVWLLTRYVLIIQKYLLKVEV